MTEFPPTTRKRRDDHSWGRADGIALLVLIAAIVFTIARRYYLALLMLAAVLTGCDNGGSSHAGTSLGERVYLATEAAWYGRADLPPVDDERGDCERLPLLELLTPVTLAEYVKHCPANSWACLDWQPLDGRVRNLRYPLAVMNPYLAADRWPAHGVHELAHAMRDCAGLGVDYLHLDKRVWRPALDSVEAVAVHSIYNPGPLIDEGG